MLLEIETAQYGVERKENCMNYAVIFAGGVGSRMNSRAKPKQFLEIHGKPILVHTIEHFDFHQEIDAICVVVVHDWLDYTKMLIDKYNLKKVRWIVAGGDSALKSQYNGLNAIREATEANKDDIVLIHDGVRPLINDQVISDCIDSVKKYGSGVTVAPAIETIIRTEADHTIKDNFPRSECQLARAPQAFPLDKIIEVHDKARVETDYSFIDSTSMLLYYGYSIHTIQGPSENIKVTDPADFYICRALLDAKENSQIYGI